MKYLLYKWFQVLERANKRKIKFFTTITEQDEIFFRDCYDNSLQSDSSAETNE